MKTILPLLQPLVPAILSKRRWVINRLLVLFLTGGGMGSYFSQTLSNYSFTPSNGSYTVISNSTFPTLSGADDGYVNNIPIGFDFWYMGVRYTSIGISANGFVSFGTLSSTYTTNNIASGGVRPLLAPLWDDLHAVTTGANISYKVAGSAPNRTFTVEFNDMRWNYQAVAAVIDFQVILYETSGSVAFVYNPEAQAYNAGSTTGASLGITATATGSNNYLSLNGTGTNPSVSFSTETNSLNSKPNSGQTYTFSPLTTSAPTNLTFSGVGLSAMTLNWTNQGSNRILSAIYHSTDNSTFTFVGTAAAGASSYAATQLAQSTTYYWKVFSVSEGYVSAALEGAQTTLSDIVSWTGTTNTDWNTATNWSPNGVPTATSEITIPVVGNNPSITGTQAAVCYNLTINSGAVLTVSSSSVALKIGGNLINNGTISHTGSTSATTASTAYWIQMTGAGKTIGGTGDFSSVGILLFTSGSTTTLTNHLSLKKMYVYDTGTFPVLNLSSYTLTVSTTFYQFGQVNLNSGTLEYTGTASETSSTWGSTRAYFAKGTGTVYLNNAGSWSYYPALDYYNLKIKTNSGQEHHGPGSETIANNLELIAGTSGGKLHHHSTTLIVGGSLTIGTGSELNLAAASNARSITVSGPIDVAGTITCLSNSAVTTSSNFTIMSGGIVTSSTASVISVGGNWVNNGTFTKSTGKVTFTGATNNTISGATTTSFYNITVDKGTDTTYCVEATGAMGMTGDLNLTRGVLKLTHSSSSAQFTASTTIPVTAGLWVNGGVFTNAANLNVLNDGLIRITGGTCTFAPAVAYRVENRSTGKFYQTDGTFIGGWRLYNEGLFSFSGGIMTLNILGSSTSTNATFESTSASTFRMSGGTIVIQNVNSGAGGDLVITSGGTKTITGGTFQIGNASTPASKVFIVNCGVPIYNLTVFSTNAPTARLKTSILSVQNNINILGGVLDANTNGLNVTIGGNWTNNSGTTINSKIGFDSGTKKVTFNGGVAQTIGGSAVTTFYDVDIANTSGHVSLAVNSSVHRILTLISNNLITQGYTLTVGTTSANGSITGGSATSYIVACDNGGVIGYVKHLVNSNAVFSYPIGDATNYVPLIFTLTSATLLNASVSVFTKAEKITGLNSAITSNFINRLWHVSESGFTTPTYSISYTYVDGDIVGSETGMLPIKLSGITWFRPSGSNFIGGTTEGVASFNAGSNLLSWTGLTNFSLFGGVADAFVALPVELLFFSGKKEGINNLLIWSTASEINNDYFTIEKTGDGEIFEIVGIYDGAGNSIQVLNYSLVDNNVRPVLNYYRLKQTDFDGNSTFSDLITVDNRSNAAEKEISMITNLLGQKVDIFYQGVVLIVYNDGTSIREVQSSP